MEKNDFTEVLNPFVYTHSDRRLLRPAVKHTDARIKMSTKPSSIRMAKTIPIFLPLDSSASDGIECHSSKIIGLIDSGDEYSEEWLDEYTAEEYK